MKSNKWAYLGAAFLGVLLVAGLSGEAVARAIRVSGESLRIGSQEGRGGTAVNTIGSGDAYIQDTLEVGTAIKTPVPAVQALAATFTIVPACGGVTRVSATADVTSDTTNTFTAPSTVGFCDTLIVAGQTSHEVILDNNALFPLAGGVASIRLAAGGSIRVWSDGAVWNHNAHTEY